MGRNPSCGKIVQEEKKMKRSTVRILSLVLCLALAFAMTACNSAPASSAPASSDPAPASSDTPASEPASSEAPKVDYPTKPIQIFNSSSAGSPADVMSRELAMALEEITGQTVTVVNKTGGSGGVMFAAVTAEKNDGYTIGTITASQIAALQAGLNKEFPIESFEFVGNTQIDPYCIFVKADSQFQTLEDLVKWSAENPGKLQLGGQGTGSALHLTALQLGRDAGFTFTWLPSEGGADTVKNVLGDHFQAGMAAPTTVKQYVEAGQLKVLAITGDKPVDSMPEVPTFQSLGYELMLTQYRGFFVKAGIDPAIKQAISDLIDQAAHSDSFKEYMAENDLPDGYMNWEDFQAYAMADYENVGKLTAELIG